MPGRLCAIERCRQVEFEHLGPLNWISLCRRSKGCSSNIGDQSIQLPVDLRDLRNGIFDLFRTAYVTGDNRYLRCATQVRYQVPKPLTIARVEYDPGALFEEVPADPETHSP